VKKEDDPIEEEQQNVPPQLPKLSSSSSSEPAPAYRTHRSNSACVANTTIPAQFASRIARRNTQVLQPMSIVVESAVPLQRPASRSLVRSTVEKTLSNVASCDRSFVSSTAAAAASNVTSSSTTATSTGSGSFESTGSGRYQSGDSMDSSTPPSTPITKHVTLDELILGKFKFNVNQDRKSRRSEWQRLCNRSATWRNWPKANDSIQVCRAKKWWIDRLKAINLY
jgi:hypothetical protein